MEKGELFGNTHQSVRTDKKIDFPHVLVTLYFALRPQRQTESCEKEGNQGSNIDTAAGRNSVRANGVKFKSQTIVTYLNAQSRAYS